MPRIRQSSRKTWNIKFIPLSVWKLTGQPNLVIHITSKARATVSASRFGIPTALYFLLNWSLIKRMNSHPSVTSKNPITSKDTCQKASLGLQNLRVCLCFCCILFLLRHWSQLSTQFRTSRFMPRQRKRSLTQWYVFSIPKDLVHVDSWSKKKICVRCVSTTIGCFLTFQLLSSFFLYRSLSTFSIILKSTQNFQRSFEAPSFVACRLALLFETNKVFG